MKKGLILLFACLLGASVRGGNVEPTPRGVRVLTDDLCMEVECFTPAIIRVKKFPLHTAPEKQSLSVVMQPGRVKFRIGQDGDCVTLATSEVTVVLDPARDAVRFVGSDGRTLLCEDDSSAEFIPFDDAGEAAYRVSQRFRLDDGEVIYGLGQHQQGRMNQRNQTVMLRQANMEICIPLIHSTKGYLLFWDNYSATTFTDDDRGMTFDSEVGVLCDYYFVRGAGADEVIARWRDLTGEAPMFPL